MKKYFILLMVLIQTTVFGQTEEAVMTEVEITQAHETALRNFVNDYFELSKVLDLDKMLDLTHPGLFEISSKDLIREQLDAAFNNEYFTMNFTRMEYAGVDEAYDYQNTIYYFTKYHSTFEMIFKKSDEQSDEAFEDYMNYLVELYSVQFNGDEVKRENNVISISGIKRLLIIDDPQLDGMKMLEIKAGMNPIYKRFIPEDVVNALGNP